MNRTIRAALMIAALAVAGPAFAQTPAAPAPAASTPATPAPAGTATGTLPARPAAHPAATGYSTEAAAKTACGTDTVVWGNPSSKALHLAGTRYYGKTKRGSYMCQQQATAAGYHGLKNDK